MIKCKNLKIKSFRDNILDGEIIVGNYNEQYQFRVLGEPRFEGTNTVYKVELMGGNLNGCPAERLLAGERFSVEFAPVEKEFSRKVGDIRFTSPTSMRNEWSIVRIQHKAPGNMIDKKLAFGIPMVRKDPSGKLVKDTANKWMHYVDWELEQQFSEYKNNALAYGRSNRNINGEYTNIGKSGGVIKTGQGLFEQMEVANTIYYNKFSLALIERALYALCAGKLGMNERTFVLKTGEMGALQFHKAVVADKGWGTFAVNADALGIVAKTSSPLHPNALKVGYQFTEVIAPNGVHLKIDVDPSYDDPIRNKIMHPMGGVANSYRYDIMDIGTMAEPNIQKCGIKGRGDIRSYQPGIRNPFTGEWNVNYAGTDEDGCTIHKMAWLGVLVLDPSRTMSIIPQVLVG